LRVRHVGIRHGLRRRELERLEKPEDEQQHENEEHEHRRVKNTHIATVAALITPLTRMTLRKPKHLMMGRAVA
jgi:hypothetical protein